MKLRHDKLREVRQRHFMTQQELADKAGTSKANISRLESGEQNARMSTILRLAKVLEVDPDELVDWSADGSEEETGKAAA